MSESPPQRVSSSHLEDLMIVALTAVTGEERTLLHSNLDNQRRARLRFRLKQIGRHDWPSSLSQDPLLRRGYTLRQCYRLLAALMLIDAHLAPSDAIAIAKTNEIAILRAIALHLVSGEQGTAAVSADDLLLVVPLGELVSLIADQRWQTARPQAIRLIRRGELPLLWSKAVDLDFPGQRLVIDIGLAAGAMWRWIAKRCLMADDARRDLLAEVEGAGRRRGFDGTTAPIQRQR